jgi:hypothetical protein
LETTLGLRDDLHGSLTTENHDDATMPTTVADDDGGGDDDDDDDDDAHNTRHPSLSVHG